MAALLTITGIMFTLSVTFLVPSGLTILALPLLVLLLITVLLISEYHGINVVSQPASTANVIQSTPNNNHSYLLLEYAEATWRNSQMHSYLVDVYRATRRTFLGALIYATIAAVMVSFMAPKYESRLIAKIRTDARLVRLLTGPRGVPGNSGVKGDRGAQGPMGPKGGCRSRGTTRTTWSCSFANLCKATIP